MTVWFDPPVWVVGLVCYGLIAGIMIVVVMPAARRYARTWTFGPHGVSSVAQAIMLLCGKKLAWLALMTVFGCTLAQRLLS